jgi:hypothetical protein
MYTGHRECYGHGWPGHHHYYPHYYPAMLVAHEIDADSTTPSQNGLVGGTRQASLSLEYLVDAGASSPSVKVTTASGGSSATWSDDAPATGYTVRQGVLTVSPGTKVTLAVTDAMARLRWCETICC